MHAKRLALCFFACSLLLLNGCKEKAVPAQTAETKTAFPITINGVTFEESPQKIVSMSAFLTDVIYDIGAESLLVGASDYCSAQNAERMGSAINPDVEKIKNSGASLVLTTTPLPSEERAELEKSSITIIELDAPVSLETLENLYASLIAILKDDADYQAQSQAVLEPVFSTIENTEKSEQNVLCIVSEQLNVAASDTLCGDLISKIAENAANHLSGYPEIGENTFDCDVVFADLTLEEKELSEYTKDAKVYYVDFSALENPSADNLQTLLSEICGNL